MTNKNKTVSFRINEEKFDALQSISDDQDLSLSTVFREYVDEIVSHRGNVEVAPKHSVRESANAKSDEFPFSVEVSKSFVREHERLELECEHLGEQLEECKRYAERLESMVRDHEERTADVVRLEEVDFEAGTSLQIE